MHVVVLIVERGLGGGDFCGIMVNGLGFVFLSTELSNPLHL